MVTTDAVSETLDGSCVIITGAPAAGKSTVSQLVAERLARSALLDGDFVNRLIVSGRVWALGEPADEATRQVRLCNKNLCALAANFADAGFTPVIDWVIPDSEQLDFFVEALRPRRVLLVVLMPSIEVHHYRNTIREWHEQFFFNDYERLTAAMRNGFGTVGWWFDTSALTPEETAAQIITNAPALAQTTATRQGGCDWHVTDEQVRAAYGFRPESDPSLRIPGDTT
jgi:hypothetical protein